MKTVEIRISGRVQGVGFRACIKRIATNLGVVGEAMNLPDGRVLVTATGEPAVLDKFVSMLYGCPRIVIRDLSLQEVSLARYPEFTIQRGAYQYST
ncbi:MAG TPA: acylphosphatase [Candidatus Methanoculleus thermohydrogenotrophicum]|jgi:acylphosphatase|nr:acylphosphatase [Candidatus Methanoculleus thermohydrogenotrophicum]HQE09634.1 acylphosphatase [Bacillota bacterium]NLM81964.1 acylphosphatase [Candidatus Methanoculleus thermohydrogenotrophicum]HOB17492.1 acylphosphatase [Candidatus Methanoculleus thermohydrogenotrophicum]HPZ37647.1 acylphosphatase [Candidatus Methanoculleus thermohydrogenotrophicum]